MDEGGGEPLDEDDDPAVQRVIEVRARIIALNWAALRPVVAGQRALLVAGIAAFAATLVAHLLVAEWLPATLIGILASVVALAVACLPMRDRNLRAALEVYTDHLHLEREAWRLLIGSPMPQRFDAMERWLDANPDAEHGRAAMLAGCGHPDEAEAALATRPSRTVEEDFERGLLVQQIALSRGLPIDCTALHRELATLTDEQRRHRRQCLAILEAQAATETGGDPIAVLASGRDSRGPVYRRSRWIVNPLGWLLFAFLPSWVWLMFSLLR